MFCTTCGRKSVYKSGFVKGEQRYKCRECGKQFVLTMYHGKNEFFSSAVSILLLPVSLSDLEITNSINQVRLCR